MQHPSFPLGAVAAAFLAASGAAHAQAAASAQAPASAASQALQTVVVSASADASKGGLKAPYAGGQVARGGRVGVLGSEDVMDTPFNITNYTSKLIQDQQSASIADVLQNDAGVRVARGFGNFQQAYMVRGFVVYSDDISYNGLYGLLPRQYLATELVERVEVLHGASGFLNGAAPGGSGVGGAINISPKRAPNAPLSEVTLGWDDGQVTESADLARRFGADKAFGLRANLVHRDGSSSAIAGEKGRLDAALLGADFHAGDLRVSADFGSQDHRLTAVTPSISVSSGLAAVPAAPDGGKQVAQPWTYSNERDTLGTLRAEYDLLPAVTAWVAAGFREGHEDNNLEVVSVNAADGSDTLYASANVRKDSIRTGEAGLRGSFTTGAVKHTVVGSYTAYRAVSRNAYGFSDYNHPVAAGTIYDTTFIDRPDETKFSGGSLANPLTTSRIVTSSVALADTLGFLGDRLLLTVGARRQKIEDSSYDYTTGALATAANTSSRVTPVGSLVFKANQQVSLYATYVEGLVTGDNAPQNYFVFQNGAFVSKPVSNAGQAFAPYQTRQGEIGVKVDTGSYGGTVSLFQARRPTYEVIDGATSGTFEQGTLQRNRGAELSVYGEPLQGVRVLGGASFLQTQVTGLAAQGRRAIGSPAQQYNLGFDFDVPAVVGLALEVRGVHTSRQYDDAADKQVVPSWTRYDLGARYAFDIGAHALTLRAGIDNVTDRKYWASVGGYPGQGYLTVGAPRTYALSGTYAY